MPRSNVWPHRTTMAGAAQDQVIHRVPRWTVEVAPRRRHRVCQPRAHQWRWARGLTGGGGGRSDGHAGNRGGETRGLLASQHVKPPGRHPAPLPSLPPPPPPPSPPPSPDAVHASSYVLKFSTGKVCVSVSVCVCVYLLAPRRNIVGQTTIMHDKQCENESI